AVGAERHGDYRALMLKGIADGLARRPVPEPPGLVGAAGKNGLAVRAERHGADTVAMSAQGRSVTLARRPVPELPGPVLAPGQNRLAVGTNSYGEDGSLMSQSGSEGLASRRVPQARRAVPTPRDDGLAVRSVGHTPEVARIHEGLAPGQSTGQIPQPCRP